MFSMPSFELQGHRGARGWRPENTLPSFEFALDQRVDSIEVDLQLSRDAEMVIVHDFNLSSSWRESPPRIVDCNLVEIRAGLVDRNPSPTNFPDQRAELPELSVQFAREREIDPYHVPTLKNLFDFVKAYAVCDQKSIDQRANAVRVILDLEIKSIPFFQPFPEQIIERLLKTLHEEEMISRCRVRAFDHLVVREILRREGHLQGGVLIAGTAPCSPAQLVEAASAHFYCPDYRFLSEADVQQVHRAGYRVLPWTVNDPVAMAKLVSWGVDGITTDFPRRLDFPNP